MDARWEDTEDLLREIVGGVNDALANGKATHEQIIERLTFLVTGTNKVCHDLIKEGSRMKPKRNLVPAFVDAQNDALHELAEMDWRK